MTNIMHGKTINFIRRFINFYLLMLMYSTISVLRKYDAPQCALLTHIY